MMDVSNIDIKISAGYQIDATKIFMTANDFVYVYRDETLPFKPTGLHPMGPLPIYATAWRHWQA